MVGAPQNPHTRQLDDVDRVIIDLLQQNSRASNIQLAAAAGIAESTCIARVRALVARGVVSRFTTELDPAALGLDLQALISVGIRAGQRHLMSSFQTEVRALPGVVQVFFLSGAEDFIIHLAVRNSAEVREFVLQHLSVHPAVASTRTSMVFDHEYNGFLAGAATAE